MSAINWEIVDREVFAEFRFADAEQIAQAYLAEAFAENPSDTRLNTLYELGQGQFSERWNSREARQALFNGFVNRLHKAGA